MARLADLSTVHDRLAELFASHQDLLLQQRLAEAQMALQVYSELLGLHMRHEEQILIPMYERLGPNPLWPTRLYIGQHRRMRELLHEAGQRLGPLSGHGPATRRAIIGVLDYETTYKHLVLHHEDAERRGLFAALEFELSDARGAELVEPCLFEWRHTERLLLGAPTQEGLAP
jgi:hypothetical protein